MTSSTKPEVHNVLHCHHSRTESWQQLTSTKNSVNLDMWFLRYANRETDRHKDMLITVLSTPTRGEVIIIL